MKTRTLILWSLVCGVIILVAGSIKLFQVSTSESTVEFLAFGEPATVADMDVTVEGFDATATNLLARVTMSGPDGADAREGWRIIAGDRVLSPVDDADAVDQCTFTGATPVTCVIAFPLVDGTPVFAYLRAGDQRQWAAQS